MKANHENATARVATQFAVVVNNGIVSNIGKSFIMIPKPNYTGDGIKWFDDTKLIRGGGAV